MCDGFNHAALQLAVAQICQSMGWDGLQKSSHDLLTDVLRHYLEEIAKSAHGYCQQYSRTEPNLDDLGLAFEDVGVLLHELEDFVSQVDQVPFIHQLPRYPKPKASVLHHPRNGEIVDRLEHYYDHLPPLLVNNLLQHEDEEKTAGETPDNPVDAGNEQEEGADGFIRKEIKTVGEETCNETVAVKRPRESPPAFEKEAKKQRLESPFLQKGNKGNEMDILHALQGNLSSPSPTPSPDAWSTEKAFEIPPIILAPTVLAHSLEKAKATSGAESRSSISGDKKQVGSNKSDRKSPTSKQKPSPKKKAKPARNTPSPARKSATPVKTTPPKLLKEKSPSPLKSPLASNKSSPKVKEPGTPNANEKKTPSKKGEKPAAKMTKVKKPPPIKSPTANPGSEIAKENIASKESMPKLIIKPIKQEVCKEPEFAVSELLPVNSSDTKEKSQQPKRTKSKQSLAEKPKPKKSKEGPVEVAVKIEPKETSIVSGNVGLKFSIADFAATTQKSPPLDKNVPGNSVTDAASEHKKKKKKHKEKDKDKEKKKDKSKKLKADLVDSSQASSYSTPAIPRIKLKLDPSSYRSVAEEPAGKPNAPRRKCGTVPGEWAGSASPSNPQAEKLQPTFSATSPAGSELENVPVAKAVVKAEPPERTVTSQTVSTTFVHGYTKEYYCPVCGDPDDGTFMIGCDGCDEWFHGRCVGIEDDPGNADWFCSSCLAKKDKDSKDKLKKKKKKKSKGKEK